MPTQFEIESIVNLTKRGYFVFARLLNPEDKFNLTDKSFLGGVALTEYLDIPRALNDKGEQRYDLYLFQIKNPTDAVKLKEKQIVELTFGLV